MQTFFYHGADSGEREISANDHSFDIVLVDQRRKILNGPEEIIGVGVVRGDVTCDTVVAARGRDRLLERSGG